MAKKDTTSKKEAQIEVEFTCHNAAGKYLLPYSYGQKIKLEAKQALELIEAKDAKEV